MLKACSKGCQLLSWGCTPVPFCHIRCEIVSAYKNPPMGRYDTNLRMLCISRLFIGQIDFA